jgi:hypothetical protein
MLELCDGDRNGAWKYGLDALFDEAAAGATAAAVRCRVSRARMGIRGDGGGGVPDAGGRRAQPPALTPAWARRTVGGDERRVLLLPKR